MRQRSRQSQQALAAYEFVTSSLLTCSALQVLHQRTWLHIAHREKFDATASLSFFNCHSSFVDTTLALSIRHGVGAYLLSPY